MTIKVRIPDGVLQVMYVLTWDPESLFTNAVVQLVARAPSPLHATRTRRFNIPSNGISDRKCHRRELGSLQTDHLLDSSLVRLTIRGFDLTTKGPSARRIRRRIHYWLICELKRRSIGIHSVSLVPWPPGATNHAPHSAP